MTVHDLTTHNVEDAGHALLAIAAVLDELPQAYHPGSALWCAYGDLQSACEKIREFRDRYVKD